MHHRGCGATEQTAGFLKLNEDAMATEKLAEGIRNFAADQEKLETMLKDKLDNL